MLERKPLVRAKVSTVTREKRIMITDLASLIDILSFKAWRHKWSLNLQQLSTTGCGTGGLAMVEK
jgi:hypothetical protein